MMDLLYEVLADSSPFYVYIGIMVSAVCTYKLLTTGLQGTEPENYSYLRACHANEAARSARCAAKNRPAGMQTWLIKITKRIEGPDDDGDHPSFLNFANPVKIEEEHNGKICIHQPWKI